MPEEIAHLDPEDQAMFERIAISLGMIDGEPDTIDRYQLRQWIARGGMGQVYRAYDDQLAREVAIKLVAPRPGQDVGLLRKRLHREAQMLAKIDDPHVVKVYDMGTHRGQVYVVMEFVNGPTLREKQMASGLSTGECLRLYADAARGLLAAHAQGVVHRDFKPDNVFIGDDGRARVGDFGLAHAIDAAGEGERERERERDGEAKPEIDAVANARLTRAGDLLGTLGYMAPEQLRNEGSDARADQYGFCVSLWEALTGERPFAGLTSRALLERIGTEPEGGKGIDARLRQVLRVGLAARAEDRHKSMATVLAAIEEVLERPARRRRWAGRGVLGAAALGGLALGVVRHLTDHPCRVADAVVAFANEADWTDFDERTPTGTRDRVLSALKADAHEACERGDDAMAQKVEGLQETLSSLLRQLPDLDADAVTEFVGSLDQAFSARPVLPLSPKMAARLQGEVAEAEAAWKLDSLEQALTGALKQAAGTRVDRSEALLRRGRVHAWRGDYPAALTDFRKARGLAEEAGDPDRVMQANLGVAKLSIMRQEELAVGEELLWIVEDQLSFRGEPIFSPRRSDALESWAMLARHDGDLDRALSRQRRVVARRVLAGALGRSELVTSLVNLGNVYADRRDDARAEAVLGLATGLDPDDAEAAYGYARFRYDQGADAAELRPLFARLLKDQDHDLHLIIEAHLLNLDVDLGDREATRADLGRLEVMLEDPEIPRTPEQAIDAWGSVAYGYAFLGDRGPGFVAASAHASAEVLAQVDADFPSTANDPTPPAAAGEPDHDQDDHEDNDHDRSALHQ